MFLGELVGKLVEDYENDVGFGWKTLNYLFLHTIHLLLGGNGVTLLDHIWYILFKLWWAKLPHFRVVHPNWKSSSQLSINVMYLQLFQDEWENFILVSQVKAEFFLFCWIWRNVGWMNVSPFTRQYQNQSI